MSTTRVLAGLVSNGNVLADGTITPSEIGAAPATSVITVSGLTYPGDDQAANPAGGQTITINGTGFSSTPTVYVGGVIAPSVSFISSTQITFTSPAKTAGTYDVYVVNPNGATAIRVYGISYSGTPTWTTPTGELGPVDANFSIQLVATGDAPMTYALTTGSTLPSGVALSSSGLITGTALTVDQTFNFSVDAIDGQSQETPRSFFVTVSLADPYFDYVTMLLSGDPTVTPFNSDASTNNFNVTINGDTKSNNFNPYQAGYYSNSFNGSSDYLTAPQATGALGTNDFTIEMWYRSSGGNGTYARAVSKGIVSTATDGAYGLGVYRGANEFYWSTYYSGSFNDIQTGINLNDGVWHHIAATRVGTTLKLYSDGVLRATGTIPSNMNFGSTTDPLMIAYQNRDNNYVNGNISNLRILIGTALYTGATYTVPTTPLTAITNTTLLTCQSNRFIDNSLSPVTISVYSSPQIAPAQPFTLPSSVATYGSGYFDGSGDYLSVASQTALGMGAGDFTYEAWIYVNEIVPTNALRGLYDSRVSGATGCGIYTSADTGNTSKLVYATNSAIVASSTNTIKPYCWTYVAVTRSSGTVRGFLNGVLEFTVTDSRTFSSSAATYIGTDVSPQYFNGYITDARILKGTAQYTSAFTPPTAPLTAITNTSLLTTQYNGAGNNNGFKDSSQNNFTITRNGNTTQGTFTPYGSNWSNYFNGSSYFQIASTSAMNMNTYACLECWVNLTSLGANQLHVGRDSNYWIAYSFSGISGSANKFVFSIYNGSTWSAVSSSTSPTAGTWYHVAGIRSGSTLQIYINGVLENTGTLSGTATTSATPIGIADNQGTAPMTGYLSNVRVNLGTTSAVLPYTANFTPSTVPLTAVTGTQLLACQNNRFVDNSTNALTLGVNGSPSVQRFSPFAPLTVYNPATNGGSGYFDGSGDYLSELTATTALNLSSGDWSISFWVYKTAASNGGIVALYNTAGNTSGLSIWVGSNGAVRVDNGITGAINAGNTGLNTWAYVEIIRSSGTTTCYVNGSSVGTTTQAPNASQYARFGSAADGTLPHQGYITDVRIVKGTALSSSVPTAPLTAVSGTSLLLNYTNAGILDNAMMNDLETVGNAQISTSVKKYGTGSMYFDGTGDYLNEPSSPNLGIGNVFTVECWLYLIAAPTASNAMYVTDFRGGSTNNYAFGVIASSGNTIFYAYSGSIGGEIRGSTNITTGTWYHLAFVNTGSTLTGYLNGVSQGTLATSYSQGATNVIIGARYTGATEYINGYIDDLRITKGVARYTANFTPPTAAFKNK